MLFLEEKRLGSVRRWEEMLFNGYSGQKGDEAHRMGDEAHRMGTEMRLAVCGVCVRRKGRKGRVG